ncbi:MAG: protein kinase [Myxococcota bacterium]
MSVSSTFVSAIAPGQVIDGRFRVEAHLGGGGMGDVYRVVLLATERVCALKVLKQQYKSDQALERRFVLEARVRARTGCEAIVETFDAGRLSDGRPFILMECLEGQDLDSYANGRPLPLAEAADYVAQACVAVHAAHRAGIVHRDLKPANLFRLGGERAGRIKVLDFGIARFSDGASAATAGFMGSPLWAAPEQMTDARSVTPRSDVYALGATLYTLLSGRPPVPADAGAAAVFDLVRRGVHEPLRAVAPHLPSAVSDAVARAMALDPEARFPSARAFAEALQATLGKQACTGSAILEDTARRAPVAPAAAAWPDSPVVRGDHALVALSPGEGARFIANRAGRAVVIARSPEAAEALRTEFLDTLVAPFDGLGEAGFWASLGLARAAELYALSDDDDFNASLARGALEALDVERARPLSVVVRLEDRTFRAAHGGELHALARAKGVEVRVVSTSLSQVRRGVIEGRPSRFRTVGAARLHVAVCGEGGDADEVLLALARQGYELERAPLLVSLVRFSGHGVSRGVLDRVLGSGLVELQSLDVDAADDASVTRAMSSLLFGDAPVSVIHCVGNRPGEGSAMGQVLERAAVHLGVPAPLFVVYEPPRANLAVVEGTRLVIARDDLEDVERRAAEEDRLARAFHQTYLAQHGHEGGPASAPWERLAPGFQDDNRNVADHVPWKMDLAGLALAPNVDGKGSVTAFEPRTLESLANVEHSRWMASKRLAGWKYGTVRNDALRLHPLLVPYAELPESEKEKDRTQLRALPHVLAPVGRLVRELVCGVWMEAATADWGPLVAELQAHAGALRQERLVVVVALVDPASLRLVEALRAAGLAYALVESPATVRVLTGVDGRRAGALRLGARTRLRVGRDDAASVRDAVFELSAQAVVGETTVCGFDCPARWSPREGWIDKGWLVLR